VDCPRNYLICFVRRRLPRNKKAIPVDKNEEIFECLRAIRETREMFINLHEEPEQVEKSYQDILQTISEKSNGRIKPDWRPIALLQHTHKLLRAAHQHGREWISEDYSTPTEMWIQYESKRDNADLRRIKHRIFEGTLKKLLEKECKVSLQGTKRAGNINKAINRRAKQVYKGIDEYNALVQRLREKSSSETELAQIPSLLDKKKVGELTMTDEFWELERMQSQSPWATDRFVREGIKAMQEAERAYEEMEIVLDEIQRCMRSHFYRIENMLYLFHAIHSQSAAGGLVINCGEQLVLGLKKLEGYCSKLSGKLVNDIEVAKTLAAETAESGARIYVEKLEGHARTLDVIKEIGMNQTVTLTS
jgi:hypothetical protein